MTDQELNIAIAELRGWSVENYGPEGYETLYWRLRRPNGSIRCDRCTGKEWSYRIFALMVPNYCGDLNAAHEAEGVLYPEQFEAYLDWLDVTCGGELCVSDMLEGVDITYTLVTATARQRAEALYRTLNPES